MPSAERRPFALGFSIQALRTLAGRSGDARAALVTAAVGGRVAARRGALLPNNCGWAAGIVGAAVAELRVSARAGLAPSLLGAKTPPAHRGVSANAARLACKASGEDPPSSRAQQAKPPAEQPGPSASASFPTGSVLAVAAAAAAAVAGAVAYSRGVPAAVMGNLCSGGEAADPSTTSRPNAKSEAPGKDDMSSNKQSVLGKPLVELQSMYSVGEILGRGQFGTAKRVKDLQSGDTLCVKSIAKRKLVRKDDIDDVKREIQIMHHLAGVKHVVHLHGAYEDKHNVHLVMELAEGGELFDRIVTRVYYSEKDAAAICRTMLETLQECHNLGVMHRDLKPENFLLRDKSDNAELMLTDFGLSMFVKPGVPFKDIVGSAYYVAPEVLRRNYGMEADVWSIGIILYILLSGVPPFWAENEPQIFDAILKADLDFSTKPWPAVSDVRARPEQITQARARARARTHTHTHTHASALARDGDERSSDPNPISSFKPTPVPCARAVENAFGIITP